MFIEGVVVDEMDVERKEDCALPPVARVPPALHDTGGDG